MESPGALVCPHVWNTTWVSQRSQDRQLRGVREVHITLGDDLIAGTHSVPAANAAVQVKVVSVRDITVTSLTWCSSTQSGNYDIGIVDDRGDAVLWTRGATAWPAVGTVSEPVPSVMLKAGRTYRFVFASDTTARFGHDEDPDRFVRGNLRNGCIPIADNDTSARVVGQHAHASDYRWRELTYKERSQRRRKQHTFTKVLGAKFREVGAIP